MADPKTRIQEYFRPQVLDCIERVHTGQSH